MKKGQVSLDFLMTYGWALLIILLVGSLVFALGIFSPENSMDSTAAGFSGVVVTAHYVNTSSSPQQLVIIMENRAGKDITIDNITGTSDYGDISYTTSTIDLSRGKSTSVNLDLTDASYSSGDVYKVELNLAYHYLVTYDGGSKTFYSVSKGTLTGKVA